MRGSIVAFVALAVLWRFCFQPVRDSLKSDDATDRGARFNMRVIPAGKHQLCTFGADRSYRAYAKLFALNDTQFYVYCERRDGTRRMCGYFASRFRHMIEYTPVCEYLTGEKAYIELDRNATLVGEVYYNSYSDVLASLRAFGEAILTFLIVAGVVGFEVSK
jgi:hypothetical protein